MPSSIRQLLAGPHRHSKGILTGLKDAVLGPYAASPWRKR
jgi:hypothetical protein